MKTMPSVFATIAALTLPLGFNAQAAPWTYRGTLNDGGKPANGRYDIRLSMLDASAAKSIGGAITYHNVWVKDGAFSVDVDFGFDLTKFQTLKLKTEVGQNGAGFVALGEPQMFDAKAALVGVCWDTQGNAGTNPTTDFLGTTDNQPIHLRSYDQNVSRIQAIALGVGGFTANINNGSPDNSVTAGVRGATIAGGGARDSSDISFSNTNPNRVTDHYGIVGGGYGNQAGDNDPDLSDSPFSTVAGGQSNIANGLGSSVSGGGGNTASGFYGNVQGGFQNTASGVYSNVAGGYQNTASGDHSNVAGGHSNSASGHHSNVAGGFQNFASSNHSNVAGGQGNQASNRWSAVGGGENNTAIGFYSTVSGGNLNCAGGVYSWASGRRAKVRPNIATGAEGSGCYLVTPTGEVGGDDGTFVWADSQNDDFESTGPNQFLCVPAAGWCSMEPSCLQHLTILCFIHEPVLAMTWISGWSLKTVEMRRFMLSIRPAPWA